MGSVELALLIKYGLPLAMKLIKAGEDGTKVAEVVTNIVTVKGDIAETLLTADDQQTQAIIDGLFGEVGKSLDDLLKAIGELIK